MVGDTGKDGKQRAHEGKDKWRGNRQRKRQVYGSRKHGEDRSRENSRCTGEKRKEVKEYTVNRK